MTKDLTPEALELQLDAGAARGDIRTWRRGGDYDQHAGWTVTLTPGVDTGNGDRVWLRHPREALVFTLALRSVEATRPVQLTPPEGADKRIRYFTTISPEDVGRSSLPGRDDAGRLITQSIWDVMGLIQLGDVGKYVYRTLEPDGQWVMSVDNAEQRDARLARAAAGGERRGCKPTHWNGYDDC